MAPLLPPHYFCVKFPTVLRYASALDSPLSKTPSCTLGVAQEAPSLAGPSYQVTLGKGGAL